MKPTIPEVLPLVHALYARQPLGCCLHNVLSDGNVETKHVTWCLDKAMELGHSECATLAQKLLHMSKTQRKQLSAERHYPAKPLFKP